MTALVTPEFSLKALPNLKNSGPRFSHGTTTNTMSLSEIPVIRVSSDPKPDIRIIEKLCYALSNFTINTDLLCNWQAELSDSAGDRALLVNAIQQEVILRYPLTTQFFEREHKEAIAECLKELNALDDDVYFDFKLIMYELLFRAATTSYTAKIQLHRLNIVGVLADDLLNFVDTTNILERQHKQIAERKMWMLISFLELGCDVKLFKKLMVPLFSKSARVGYAVKQMFMDLLILLLAQYPSHFSFLVFNSFRSRPLSIPFVNDVNPLKCLTIYSWLKLNNLSSLNPENDEIPVISLFSLANSSDSYSSVLKVQLLNYNQIMIEILNRSTGSRMQFTFNQIIDSMFTGNQGYTHFALTYDSYHNLNLFIDGEYSESIPCPALSKILSSWNKMYIGYPQDAEENGLSSFNRDELILKDLTVLNTTLTYEWISALYYLGLGFDWSQKEFSEENVSNLLNQLNPTGLVELGLKVREIVDLKQQSRGSSTSLARQHKKTSSASANVEVADKKTIARLLNKTRMKKSNILFDSSETGFIDHVERPKSLEILVHASKSVHGSMYCLGGASLLLTLIEVIAKDVYELEAERNSLVFISIELLLLCLLNSWRINKEFENIDGYCILLLLLSYYKDHYNPLLTFNVEGSNHISPLPLGSSNSSSENEASLLKKFLSFSGCGQCEFESIIYNQQAYKFLILNFDLYSGTSDYILLQTHLQDLIVGGKYNSYNVKELSKMKLLRRLIQFMKLQILDESKDPADLEELSMTLSRIIRSEISVETIRSISHFVIFALYNKSSNEESQKLGLVALQSLTDELCDPASSIKLLKKFSRSITIHWILLLLNYQREPKTLSKRVVCCGITLLVRLLRVLGPHVIKRFFHTNRGLDVLTHFLRNWWNDDDVLSFLFLASFGLEATAMETSESSLPKLVRNKKIQGVKQLPMPDFMLLLNNMALTAMYVLSLKHGRILSVPSSPIRSSSVPLEDEILDVSFNALHLINQYAEAIEIGYDDSPALQAYFSNKDWLEGAFELYGHLRLSLTWSSPQLLKSFEKCTEKFISVLSNIFVSKLLNIKLLFGVLKSLNDITTKTILDSIFPRIFQHINQFVADSNFIFNEKEFLEGTADLLHFYYSEFIRQNFYVSDTNLDTFITCTVLIVETIDGGSAPLANTSLKMKDMLGHSLVLKLSNLSYVVLNDSEVNPDPERTFQTALDEAVKFLLYKQIIFLQSEVLSDAYLGQVIELLMGNFLKLKVESQVAAAEHLLNFLRTCYMMRQKTFPQIVNQLTAISDYKNSTDLISEFFEDLVSKNDEETIKHLQRFPTIKHIFNKNYHFRLSKLRDVGSVDVLDMTRVMLNNGGSLGYMDNVYIKSFEKDCESLKVQTINGELFKYNRELQDKQENNQFFISSFNALKLEIFRLATESQAKSCDYILDYIEGLDRMRKLLVVEDQLAESERLSYNITVPVKQLDPIEVAGFEDYSFAFAHSGVDTLSLSENPMRGSDAEEFEEVDDGSEIDSEGTNGIHEDRNRKVIRSLFMGDQIHVLWNVSRINGLDAVESLMILGFSHLYLIENYFHCADGNVVEIQDAPMDLRDPYLQLINSQSGYKNGSRTHRTKSWSLENLSSISKRKFLLRDIALEMFFSDGASILITCLSSKQRDIVHGKLSPYATGKGLDRDLATTLELSSNALQNAQSSNGSFFASKLASAFSTSFNTSPSFLMATRKWRMGEMSNFYYLMTINTMAGRTFNDLTQYPVFPWVIADYDSDELDFSDPKTFRDLSKPMGAQTVNRARQFQERFEALGSLNDENSPPFHFGTHYSSAMIVSSYLIRLKPYVQSYLLLQGGKFDHADRLFNSIGKAWLSASRDNTTDVRELTPEFFHLPEFLVNLNNFEFGKLQSGESTNDVELPKWAKGDPKIFIAKNREALESPYVSANLHKWIDLVFGYKQNGPEAVKALNVFHHLSYDGAINLDNIKDDVEKRAVIGMINNFGQTPMKLFTKPHICKEILNLPYLSLIDVHKGPPITTFESKLNLPIEKLEVSSKTKKWIGRPACVSSEDELLIRKPSGYQSRVRCGSLIINTSLFLNLHLANITSVLQLRHKHFVTGSEDGVIHVWKCSMKPNLSVGFQHILRGHFSAIKSFAYSKTFKVCLSLDADGGVVLWDFTRFKFVRRITPPTTAEHVKALIAISNDTGNFCTLYSTKYSNILTVYTLNGEVILQNVLGPGSISAFTFASINNSQVESVKNDYHHTYWAKELIVVCYDSPHKNLQVYELVVGQNLWELPMLQSVGLGSFVSGSVTAIEVFKRTDVDTEEKLIRGHLSVVMGDAHGTVYVM